MSNKHHSKPEGAERIPDSFAHQLETLLPDSPFFLSALAAQRNATADIVSELLSTVLSAYPEQVIAAMEELQKLKLPTGEAHTDAERAALVVAIQERMGLQSAKKKPGR